MCVRAAAALRAGRAGRWRVGVRHVVRRTPACHVSADGSCAHSRSFAVRMRRHLRCAECRRAGRALTKYC